MRMEHPELLLALVALLCGLIVLEAVVILLWNLRISRALGLLQSYLDRSLSSLTLEPVHRILESVARVQAHLPELEKWSSSLLHSLSGSLERGDGAFDDTLDRFHGSFREVDRMVQNALNRFVQRSHQVHLGIMHPTFRLSDLFRTSLKALQVLVARTKGDNGKPVSIPSDESDFI